MREMVESLSTNPVVTLGSFILAVLGIILAIVFYIRSQKNKTPCFEGSSNTLIEGLHKSLDGLEIHYKGQSQERITVTKIVFWNAGKDTIDSSDLVELDQLRVATPKSIDILDIKIIDVSSSSNSVSLGNATEDETTKSYPLKFEYLDNEDYFVIQIIHNGSCEEYFHIAGKIKGVKSLIHDDGLRLSASQSKILKFVPIMPLPFAPSLDVAMRSPLFMKYFGSLTYVIMGLFAIWNLFIGNTEWYVWVGAGFCFVASLLMYFSYRYVPPVKI